MLPPTPLSLLCAVLLCLPLAVIFTFTTPSSTTSAAVSSGGGAATSSLSLTTSSTSQTIIINPEPTSPAAARITTLPKPQIKNQTTANYTAAAPPPFQLSEKDEADDQSLFKLASRADPSPNKPTKKVAFLFLTTSPLPFAPLWELFFRRGAPKNSSYNIYVHADPRLNYTAAFQGVFSRRAIPSKPTRRHSPTLISAARRLLAHALLHDESNSMFVLLSPSCIPIHSFAYTYRTLVRSRRSFIEILKDEPGAWERWAARGEEAMAPEVEFEDFRIGSQFWAVRRKHARVIVRDRMRLWSKFKLPCLRDDTCYPEEHYFPTLLSMVDPRGCIPCTLTHVDWRGSHGGHPRMYKGSEVGPELIRALRRERPRYGDERSNAENSTVTVTVTVRRRHHPFLFARKFAPGSLHQLMAMANDVILRD